MIEIRHRYSDRVLYRVERAETMREAVEKAVRAGASLDRANLTGAIIDGANLTEADLVGARLDRANLDRANLTGANLALAELTEANLVGANLTGARLVGARLADADLTRADLTGANLTRANLTGASLDRADLTGIRRDIHRVLDAAPAEVGCLLSALRVGGIDGSKYSGACSCLVGTVARVRGCSAYDLTGELAPHVGRPAERWFLAIRPGDTPANHPVAKITERWILEWQEIEAREEGSR